MKIAEKKILTPKLGTLGLVVRPLKKTYFLCVFPLQTLKTTTSIFPSSFLLAIVEHAFSPHGILAFEKLVYIIHFQLYTVYKKKEYEQWRNLYQSIEILKKKGGGWGGFKMSFYKVETKDVENSLKSKCLKLQVILLELFKTYIYGLYMPL